MKKHAPARQTDVNEVVYGLRAALAVFERRPETILRIVYHREIRRHLANLERWAAAQRIPCTETNDDDHSRFSGVKNHEGLCLEVTPRSCLSPQAFADKLVRTKGTAIALERIRNPYNIGAILRSAAFLDMDVALLGAPAPHPGLPADAVFVRTREGAMRRTRGDPGLKRRAVAQCVGCCERAVCRSRSGQIAPKAGPANTLKKIAG